MRLHTTKIIYIGLLCLGVYLFSGHSSVQAARVKGEEGVKAAAAKSASQSPRRTSVASAQTEPPSRSPARPQPTPVNRQPVQEEAPKESEKGSSSAVTINFSDTDITLFIKYIGELTGKIFVVDDKVRGKKVNIFSSKEVSVEDAYRLFESVLEVHGFTTIPSGDVTKIVAAVDARSKNIETKLREAAISPDDRVETRLIQLKYADPEDLKRNFTNLMKNMVMIAYAPTGMLIVTDVKSNIKRLLQIIDEIDVEGMGEQIEAIPLEYATASEIAQTLKDVYQGTTRGAAREAAARSRTAPIIVPYDRTNDLIVRATETETLGIKAFIKLLDKETVRGEGDIHVRYLQNANAEDLAQTLTSIRSGEQQTAKKGEAPIISKGVQIVPDKATNSLIIMAKKEDHTLLEDVIAQLDIRRQQVYIEALFMEVGVTKDLDLGVEWHTGETVGSTEGTDIIGFGRQVQNQTFPTSALSSTGLSFGILGEDITLGNVTFPSIAAVANAMETESDVTILQNPQIVATDNEEATLNVGKNVPFLTRGERQELQTAISYANYEWRDVGVILKITPQINLEREVTLKLSLEISQVVQEEGVETGLLSTLNRSLETTLTVKDAHTVAMGGLIEKTLTDGVTRTPCLGSIPLLGWLFKGIARSDDKTKLYIFLTPRIIENSEEAKEIYQEKRDEMDGLTGDGVIKMYEGRPSDTEDMVLSDQGFELLEADDYDTAQDYFERALEINPDNPYALLNLGVVYDVKGEREKAIKMYEKVIKLDPEDRAGLSTNPDKIGNRLGDIAKDNLKRLRNP